MVFIPEAFENRIKYTFHNKNLLQQALTHSSFTNEQKINRKPNYERLEFLGDAVLEMVSSEFLFHRYPHEKEGTLSKMRASMVCEPALAFCAREIGLEKFIFLGKGEEQTGGRDRDSIVSDVMEAVIGAIYLDGGIEQAKKYILSYVLNDLENKTLFYDSKSNLQELAQGKLKQEVKYKIVENTSHLPEELFKAEVYLDSVFYAEGKGRTKKAAEAEAAYKALLVLRDKGYVFKKY